MSRYDTLYNNMKNKFTVVNGESEYTLGEYMLMKAKEQSGKSNLPVAHNATSSAVVSILSYVNDKLTIKTPPAKDKTIKAFPFRTSFSALVSSLVACTFIFSFGVFGFKAMTGESGSFVVAEAEEEIIENETEYSYE